MRPVRRLLASAAAVLTATGALLLVPTAAASAHPLGNFTVNRYDGLVVAPGVLRVTHIEDLAEIPATQAKPDIKRLGMTEWARERCDKAAEGSKVTVDGRTVALTPTTSTARLRPGQAGLNTLRLECSSTAPLPKGSTVALGFHSAGLTTGPGWREITARADRMTLTGTDVPKKSVSHELTSYPKDLLSSPADITKASLRARPGGPALTNDDQSQADSTASNILPRGVDRWTEALTNMVARHHLSVGFAALSLLIAIALGAMHALAPGHGKTLMAATAAARGGRARLKDVLPLAASVTVTHTLGVIALGLLVTAGSAATPSVIAWLGIASGVLVLFAGGNLLRRAWRNRPRPQATSHSHEHPHPHPHGHDHSHETAKSPQRSLVLASAHTEAGATHTLTEGHPHPHSHDDDHAHGHDHGHEHPHPHDHDHEHGHTHDHDHAVEHTHGGFTHTHSTAPTLRGTILLGFAGGLVPSPSAVVVLVGAAALGQAWFGLLLVVAYGVGLALTLTAAGFAVVKLGTGMNRVLDRRPRWTTSPMAVLVRRTLPLASAFVVVALGVGLVLKGAASALG
ncbi:ABC-type nickel/cobalt efflux system, permease component RcnA [Streptomyces sp. 3213]|uniref:HoxN/HupN/NixA family nickel/cobalt transporter n=1 Tax=Streptomyces sp. 3213.3 TaxID=1855348 RepID=UPI00089ACDB2|nr:sulfite exporter TauE/SafE family protein [Streptomyces sp. 3213.3]SED09900.1 ABC-type nickel/cobalt efflux system, permease component RcnA [Streptomyces sp. 3213] [Streptomyces sp. 3213.3]